MHALHITVIYYVYTYVYVHLHRHGRADAVGGFQLYLWIQESIKFRAATLPISRCQKNTSVWNGEKEGRNYEIPRTLIKKVATKNKSIWSLYISRRATTHVHGLRYSLVCDLWDLSVLLSSERATDATATLREEVQWFKKIITRVYTHFRKKQRRAQNSQHKL